MPLSPKDQLTLHRASQTMAKDGFVGALANLTDPKRLQHHFLAAKTFVGGAIAAVKAAPGGDEFGSDDEICLEILTRIEKSKE